MSPRARVVCIVSIFLGLSIGATLWGTIGGASVEQPPRAAVAGSASRPDTNLHLDPRGCVHRSFRPCHSREHPSSSSRSALLYHVTGSIHCGSSFATSEGVIIRKPPIWPS
jgi:hypothetical protein